MSRIRRDETSHLFSLAGDYDTEEFDSLANTHDISLARIRIENECTDWRVT